MKEFLPYIVTIISTTISGLIAYITATKKTKIEIAKMKLEHEQKIELIKIESEKKLENDLLIEAMKIPVIQQAIAVGAKESMRKK